ncbi:MAG: hypothetical protein LBG83_05790 [Oscillospiraceae bacterium]|jgi:hypothetical protein|nr:hypothetical protein [Oscillospiraceae bacterium]
MKRIAALAALLLIFSSACGSRPAQPAAPTTVGIPTTTEPPTTTEDPNPTAPPVPEDTPVTMKNNILIVGDRAMGGYGFDRTVNTNYTKLVNRFAEKYQDQLRTSVILAPLPCEFYLPAGKSQSSSQKEALAFIGGQLLDRVNFVNIYNTIVRHVTEYLYFRTDHHWTGLAAYYAYADYMRSLGLTAAPLETYESYEHSPFLGSLYLWAGKPAVLKEHPDTCVVYRPLHGYEQTIYYNGLSRGASVMNMLGRSPEEFTGSEKYLAYAGGDPPYQKIITENKTGRNVLVFKESFANAMLPFLVEHFEEIHVIDYRYFTDGSCDAIIRDNGINEALFMHYIGAAGTGSNVVKLQKVLGVQY